MILIIDYEKAFDKLSHNCILKTLSFFNFGPVFINWIKTFYGKISSTIINNGWTSKYFNITQGVRQGCPLSPYLFVICAEIFSIALRHNNSIKGIPVSTSESKLVQYADDTNITITASKESLEQTVKLLHEFEMFSNLKVNYDKTEILRIGSIRNTDFCIETKPNFKWTNGPTNVLGVTISTKTTEIEALNYRDKLDKLKTCLNIWNTRNLTLIGKICVVNSLAISKLMYLASILGTPDGQLLADIQKIIFAFIWNNKPDKIKRSLLFLPKEKGGLGLKNLVLMFKSLNIAWIHPFQIMQNEHPLLLLVNRQLCHLGGDIIWKCTLSCTDDRICKIQSTFVKQIVMATADLEIDRSLKETIIWNNKYICIQNKTLFWRDWRNGGILYVSDILKPDGSFVPFKMLQNKHNIPDSDYLSYLGLITTIPRIWKVLIKDNKCSCMTTKSDCIDCNHVKCIPSKCNQIYELFNTSSNECIKNLQIKWGKELSVDQEKILSVWNSIYKNIYSCTVSTKYRSFQYRFLSWAVITNKELLKYGIIESDLCTFCGEAKETVTHLFWECRMVQKLWKKLKEIVLEQNISSELNIMDAFLGISASNLINLICVVVKQYIYFCRCKNITPIVEVMLNRIKEVKNIEYKIASVNDTVTKHSKKWTLII